MELGQVVLLLMIRERAPNLKGLGVSFRIPRSLALLSQSWLGRDQLRHLLVYGTSFRHVYGINYRHSATLAQTKRISV